MLDLDSRTPVLIAVIGAAVTLIGLEFCLLGQWWTGFALVGLGLSTGSVKELEAPVESSRS
ncbi:MAG: hypothetical protein JWR27_3092 [Aeromicrobium sp.]|nr:hypothetical protein [Aeromicrobium sp.]